MELLQAIARGDVNAVTKLLANGVDPDAPDAAGTPALILAVDGGQLAMVQALLKGGADKEARDAIGWTALMAAVVADSEDLVEQLIAAGANPNHVAREDTPLTCAATDASSPVLQRLLDAGADPDLRRPDGWTPLMLAAYRGEADHVDLLLARGADPTVTLGARLTDAATIAAANEHTTIASVLHQAADAANPDPGELWSAVLAWCEERAPELGARFVRQPSQATVPEDWEPLPADLHAQLTSWAPGLPFYDYEGLDLDEAIALSKELCDQAEAGAFVGRQPARLGQDEPINRVHWSEGWVPIAKDSAGNLLVVDLEPRPNGLRGQLVSWSVLDGPIAVLASGLTPWLRNFVLDVRRDRVRYDARTGGLRQASSTSR